MTSFFRTEKKDKAQQKDGFHSSVFSEETATTPYIEGMLQKKNPYGMMQVRFFYLNNGYLIYKKNKTDREVKGIIDLSETTEFTIKMDRPTDIDVKMKEGGMALLRTDTEADSRRWVVAVQERMSWCAEQLARRKEAAEYMEAEENRKRTKEKRDSKRLSIAGKKQLAKEGWLSKESAGSGAFQDRYVRVSEVDRLLRYYRNDHTMDHQGTVNLEACFVRAFDATSDNCKFEVGDKQRVYTFEAETHHSMKEWLRVLIEIKEAIARENEAILATQTKLDTPVLIRIMDEQGLGELVDCVGEELGEIYPDDPSMTVRDHLKAATELIGYIKDAVKDTAQSEAFPVGRLDVLAVVMVLTNLTLESRLEESILLIVDGNVSRDSVSGQEAPGDEKNTEGDDANDSAAADSPSISAIPITPVSEVYALIDWIGKFEKTLKQIYCPATDYADGRDPLENGLFQFLPDLCKKYEEACAGQLKAQCITVWENFTKDPAQAIQKHQDGTFFTHQPTDIWEALNNHLSLATSTNAKVLHVLVADRIVDAITAIAKLTHRYVQNFSQVLEEEPPLREMELELLSALANDTAMHIEEVVAVVHSFKLEQIRSHIDELFDDVSDLLVICGQSCMQRLVNVVMQDVKPILQDLWTIGWQDDDVKVTASAIATTGDYMQDFSEFLVPFWANKLAKELFSTLIVTYGQVILAQAYKEATQKIANTFGSMLKGLSGQNKKKLVKVSDDSIAQLDTDINTIRIFLDSQVGSTGETENHITLADELTPLLEDLMNMIALDEPNEVFELAAERINEYPSSAAEVGQLCFQVLSFRPDCGKATAEEVKTMLEPTVEAAANLAQLRDDEGIVEGWRGKMFHELMPNLGAGAKQATITSRLRELAKKPAEAMKKLADDLRDADDDDAGEEEDGFDQRPSLGAKKKKDDHAWSAKRASVMVMSNSRRIQKEQLMDVVMGVLQTEDGKIQADKMLMAEAQAQMIQEKGKQKVNDGVIDYCGNLEKRGGATGNMWQNRFFKVTTRTGDIDPETGVESYTYFLAWYKKEGGSLAKSFNIREKVMGMSLLWSSREIAYSEEHHQVRLKERQSMSKHRSIKKYKSVPKHGHEEHPLVDIHPNAQCYIFQLHVHEGRGAHDGERDIVLKTSRIDLLVEWMNTMILAAQFRYHESVGGWVAPTVSEADIATSVGHDEKAACVFNFFKSKEST